ncbi:hypothetical protein Tco_0308865 [Tanacetum coccineum]
MCSFQLTLFHSCCAKILSLPVNDWILLVKYFMILLPGDSSGAIELSSFSIREMLSFLLLEVLARLLFASILALTLCASYVFFEGLFLLGRSWYNDTVFMICFEMFDGQVLDLYQEHRSGVGRLGMVWVKNVESVCGLRRNFIVGVGRWMVSSSDSLVRKATSLLSWYTPFHIGMHYLVLSNMTEMVAWGVESHTAIYAWEGLDSYRMACNNAVTRGSGGFHWNSYLLLLKEQALWVAQRLKVLHTCWYQSLGFQLGFSAVDGTSAFQCVWQYVSDYCLYTSVDNIVGLGVKKILMLRIRFSSIQSQHRSSKVLPGASPKLIIHIIKDLIVIGVFRMTGLLVRTSG